MIPITPRIRRPAQSLLLSDGYTNIRGIQRLRRGAKNRGYPIYTIAYGTDDGYVVDQGRREPVPVNHEELQRVADISGGKSLPQPPAMN